MKQKESIVVLDFGSQHSQLIARRIRENRVYSEVVDPAISAEELRGKNVAGIILSGGSGTVWDDAPPLNPALFALGVPVLGVGYGFHAMAQALGGAVERCEATAGAGAVEEVEVTRRGDLLEGVPERPRVWLGKADRVAKLPRGFVRLAVAAGGVTAGAADPKRRLYGLQFHPEMSETKTGKRIVRNFAQEICGCRPSWTPRAYVEHTVEALRARVGDGHVICGLSGGVDSSVTAMLLHRAIGDQLTCIFVDTGLMRLHEADQVMEMFGGEHQMRIRRVDASGHFLKCLKGVTDPEEKRKIIGREFIEVFSREAKSIPKVRFLAQGTVYPDVIESEGIGRQGKVIKSHHNVGGLPEKLGFELVEPLRMLFKDEVRKIGEVLEMDHEMVWRQPFPGPGLAVRCLGEITVEKLDILRAADAIMREEVQASSWRRRVWQGFAALLPIRTVGIKGERRSYDYTCVVRAVDSVNGMTAEWVRLPHALLARISERITSEVDGINRVVYDITSKPPSTIEWE